MTPKGHAVLLLLDALESIPTNTLAGQYTTGHKILRHAITHLVDPMWNRRWPSAVPDCESHENCTACKVGIRYDHNPIIPPVKE